MKNYLIRSGMSPFDNFDAPYIINNNSIGRNVGNLVYAYGVYRTLLTDSVDQITPNYYKSMLGQEDEINEKYDAFIIPLADAFRADFMPELRNMTKLIRKLKIPCVVIGVGLRAPFEPGEKLSYAFDEDIKDFMKAVLEKSAMIGVRGEYTSAYLKSLGFREEIDHTVIGCPSMYSNGPDIRIRELKLTEESRISVNRNVLSTETVQGFLDRVEETYPNHYFLPQILGELRLLYSGLPYFHKQRAPYPTKLEAKIYAEDRVKFFLNVPTWREFLSGMDLSVGTRLHGNITACISGCPGILIAHDARTRELTEYHHLAHVWAKDITEKTDLKELVAKVDFQEVARYHQKNFEHYVEFLDKNSLEHIYQNGANPKEAPLDRRLKEIALQPPVSSAIHCSVRELIGRLEEIMPTIDKNADMVKSENIKVKAQLSDARREKEKQKAEVAKQKAEVAKLKEEKKTLQAEKQRIERELREWDRPVHNICRKAKNKLVRQIKG